MKKKDEDLLHLAVVASAVLVLALVAWAGGRRLLARWGSGPEPVAPAAPPRPAADGVDRPPTVIPPLALVGVKPETPSSRPRTQPAARPMPPVTPDRE